MERSTATKKDNSEQKMIKITTELKQNAGFTSKISVLEITSYTINETVQLTTGSTMPLPQTGKNINVNFQLYRSITDKSSGASSYQAVGFPYSFSIQPALDDEVNESYVYNQVAAQLSNLGYANEFV